jgi:hypothetical protein
LRRPDDQDRIRLVETGKRPLHPPGRDAVAEEHHGRFYDTPAELAGRYPQATEVDPV